MLLDLLPHAANGRLVHVEGDLGMPTDEFIALVPENTEVIFHICHLEERQKHAARPLTAPGFQPEGAEEHKRVNRHAMDSVIQAAKARPVRRVVYCSSWSSYGRLPAGTDVTEDTRSRAHDLIDPKCCCCCCGPAPSAVPYFESKFELEQQLREALTEGVGSVILQPCTVLGRYGDSGWCTIFGKLLQSGGNMPGLPGSSSFVDVQDLALAFVGAVDIGPGEGESYILGGTNATNLQMQSLMALLVGTPAPTRATPAVVLKTLSKWNEMLLNLKWLRCLRVKPDVIASPWLVAKLTQDQSTDSTKARHILGYRPRPLEQILKRNYDWLVSARVLPLASDKSQ